MLNSRVVNSPAVGGAGNLYVVAEATADIAASAVISSTAAYIRGADTDILATGVCDPTGTRRRLAIAEVQSSATVWQNNTATYGATADIEADCTVIAAVVQHGVAAVSAAAVVEALVADKVGGSEVLTSATISAAATRTRLTFSDEQVCTAVGTDNDSLILVTQLVYSDIEATGVIWPVVGIKASGASGYTVEAWCPVEATGVLSIAPGWYLTREEEAECSALITTEPERHLATEFNAECSAKIDVGEVRIFVRVGEIECSATLDPTGEHWHGAEAETQADVSLVMYPVVKISGGTTIIAEMSAVENSHYIRGGVADIEPTGVVSLDEPLMTRGAVGYVLPTGIVVFDDDEISTGEQASVDVVGAASTYAAPRLWLQGHSDILGDAEVYGKAIVWVRAYSEVQGSCVLDATIYSNIGVAAPPARTVYVGEEQRTVYVDYEDRTIKVT